MLPAPTWVLRHAVHAPNAVVLVIEHQRAGAAVGRVGHRGQLALRVPCVGRGEVDRHGRWNGHGLAGSPAGNVVAVAVGELARPAPTAVIVHSEGDAGEPALAVRSGVVGVGDPLLQILHERAALPYVVLNLGGAGVGIARVHRFLADGVGLAH